MSGSAVFGGIADVIIRSFAPRRVFDAGCALGSLVEALWDRGVETQGRDISDLAIAQVRADVRPFCAVGSVADPIDGEYDLVTCIEVLQHMPEADALRAIGAMTRAAPRILFSSSPTDLVEPAHINVRPTLYWLQRFAAAGFAPATGFDAGFVAPHAFVLERAAHPPGMLPGPGALAAFADHIRLRVALAQTGGALHEARAALAAETARADAAERQAQAEAGLRAAAAARTAAARQDARAARAQLADEDHLRAELHAARLGLDRLHHAVSDQAALAEERLRHIAVTTQELSLLRDSQIWRVGTRLQRAAGAVPGPVRRLALNGARTAWWIASLQLGRRLGRRRVVREEARRIAASGLFDAAWYRSRYPDVARTGMDPALHYVLAGAPEGRDPAPDFDAALYLARHPDAAGQNPVMHALVHGHAVPLALPPPEAPRLVEPPAPPPLEMLVAARFPALQPLPTCAVPSGPPRLTIVTDSIGAGSLYGGVGTALTLGALLAARMGAGLRVVTRTEPPDAAGLAAILRINGVAEPGAVELLHAPEGPGGRAIPVSPGDVFLTTSWWTTWCTRRSVAPGRIVYLVQEDERMFYPAGDDQLRCTETLSDSAIAYVVNCPLLRDHFAATGLPLPGGAPAFEPAFPSSHYFMASHAPDRRKQFFLYARPHNPRNLYYRGLEVLGAAIEAGVLPPEAWDFNLVGKDIHAMALPGGAVARRVEGLDWAGYAAMIRGIDVGLSLMYTPHPSYPPLDLAASGAVVVTNRFPGKPDLGRYSANIITADPGVDSLVAALRDAVALAADGPARRANHERAGLARDWNAALDPVVADLVRRF